MDIRTESRAQTETSSGEGSVGETLDVLKRSADGKPSVTIGTVVDTFDARSYGAFLLVPALLEISPIGGIPGVPTVIAVVIVLFAGQILFGRKSMWLPAFLRSRALSSDKLRKAIDKLRPVARFMDRWFRGRLPLLTSAPFMKGAALACILLAFTVPPLELVPFASTAPMAAVAAFGLAMLVRDGALMVVAYALTLLTAGIGLQLLLR